MATPNFRYLGNHVGTICHLGYTTADGMYTLSKEAYTALAAALTKDIADHPELGLLAITADYYQAHIHDLLKTQGFRKVMVFKSSHNRDNEHLTMWVRENATAANTKYTAPDPCPILKLTRSLGVLGRPLATDPTPAIAPISHGAVVGKAVYRLSLLAVRTLLEPYTVLLKGGIWAGLICPCLHSTCPTTSMTVAIEAAGGLRFVASYTLPS